MRVSDAITGRQSIRAFLSERPVDDEQIEALLTIAGRAPSGSNIQPWHVYIVRGETKHRITEACTTRYLSGDEGEYEYHYYPGNGGSPILAGAARPDSVSMVSWVLTAKMSRPYRAIVLRTMRSSERLSGYFLRLIETWSRAAGSITACSSNHLCWPQERQAWRAVRRRPSAPTTIASCRF